MKWKQVLQDYFSFNKAEQRGICVLLALLLGLVLVYSFIPISAVRGEEDFSAFEKEIIAFEQEVRRLDTLDSLKRIAFGKYPSRDYPGAGTATGYRMESPSTPAFVIDLNHTDTLELQRLKGIGPGFARRIMAYGKRLGGYVSADQVLEVFGMDAERYGVIREYLIAGKDSVKRIDINNVTFKELMKHPYFPYELTREIILQRTKQKVFTSAGELRNVRGMTDSLYRRILPYVMFD